MVIDDKTKIQLAWVFAAVPFIVASIVWLTLLHAGTAEAQRTNAEQDARLSDHDKQLNAQMIMLIKMDAKLNTIVNNTKGDKNGRD